MNLENTIKEILRHEGMISLSSYMSLCLSHPQFGYYQKKDPFGEKGDFITSPEISQTFGEMIGVWAVSEWQRMGAPEINIIEVGPGRGTLMEDFLRATKHVPDFHASININMVETSAYLIKLQREKLSGKHSEIKWDKDLLHLNNRPFILIANELFDALPVHQYIKMEDGWHERMVTLDENNKLSLSISPKLFSGLVLDGNYPSAKEGDILEISPASESMIKQISHLSKQFSGVALIIDYGYSSYQYGDTVQAMRQHKYHNILENPGDADITAHVNFTRLQDVAEDYGLISQGIITQREFLLALGIETRRQSLLKNSPDKRDAINAGVDRLIDQKGMGGLFKVLMLTPQLMGTCVSQ